MFSKSSVGEWWIQRIFAFLSVPLILYVFWYFFPRFVVHGNQLVTDLLIMHPIQVSLFIFLVFFLLFHSLLGMKVVMRDYIPSSKIRLVLFLLLDFFSCLGFVLFAVAVLLSSQIFS